MNNIIEWYCFSGICLGDKDIKKIILLLFKLLVVLYLEVCKIGFIRREFFGLRDFYRLDLDLF